MNLSNLFYIIANIFINVSLSPLTRIYAVSGQNCVTHFQQYPEPLLKCLPQSGHSVEASDYDSYYSK